MKENAPNFVTQIVADAGGSIVGRTRLQKIAYLLNAAGFGSEFTFEYKNFGPFSDGLKEATQVASLFGDLVEEERKAAWGGSYFVFRLPGEFRRSEDAHRVQLVETASGADAVELELAATAVFLSKAGFSDPWSETARRKPEKASNGRLAQAKALYGRLKSVSAPQPLPPI